MEQTQKKQRIKKNKRTFDGEKSTDIISKLNELLEFNQKQI